MSYVRQRTLGRYGKTSQQSVTSYTFPASVGGVNVVDSFMQMPPQDCLYTYNLMPSELGMRLRKGYVEWSTGCVESPQRADNVDVHTIIPFESNIQDAANDRLFAVTAEGIWNTTQENDSAPVQQVVFSQLEDPSGYGVWCEFTGDAAGSGTRGHYLFYADGLNGLWEYKEETDVWAQPPAKGGDGGSNPVDPPAGWYFLNPDSPPNTATDYFLPFPVDDIAFVMVFKQRIWIILEDEDDAWYLPIASVAGELKKFTFGSKMPHGGNLQALYNWTVDGGAGVDDLMVAISRGGDVIVYQGEDPEITPNGTNQGPWSTRGAWYIGEVPATRRLAVEYGPDLYILSTFGLTSLNTLLQGVPMLTDSPSRKINRFLRADVEAGKNSYAWQMTSHPGDGFLQIITPKPRSTPYVQYNMNLQTGAWGLWENVPIFCADSWSGEYYMGGPNGTVFINDGGVDNKEITKPNQWTSTEIGVRPPEWTDFNPDEYYCDGSQAANTELTFQLASALTVGENYVAQYRIRPGIIQNFWQNSPTTPPGPEWSNPLPVDYQCDGTQIAETEYSVNTLATLKAGVRYDFSFLIKNYVAGNYKVKIGGNDGMGFSAGNGRYSFSFTPTVDQTVVSLVGNAAFNGTFTEVIVAYSDGAGIHSLNVGTATVVPEATGSGTYISTFTAFTPETELSIVGDVDFVGVFYDISISVENRKGDPIAFRTLTSFQAPQGHANFSKVGLIRTVGVLAGGAAINVRAVYDYSVETVIAPPPTTAIVNENIWDSALWDKDFWDATLKGKSFIDGSLGIGRSFAVAMTGNANTRINIIGWDILYQKGGFL